MFPCIRTDSRIARFLPGKVVSKRFRQRERLKLIHLVAWLMPSSCPMPLPAAVEGGDNILVAIPLFDEHLDQLPRQNEHRWDAESDPKVFSNFRRNVLKENGGKNDPVHCAILLALDLIRNGNYNEDIKKKMSYIHGSDPLSYCRKALLNEAFDLLHETETPGKRPISLSQDEWNDLVRRLSQHVMYLSCEHPYVHYANHVVPMLTNAELLQLSKAVPMGGKGKRIPARVLDLQKTFVDLAAKETCYFAAILRDETIVPRCFSCFPSTRLEWPSGKPVQLYVDAKTADSPCTIMPVLDSEDRDDAYQQRTGSSCSCDRCQFELFDREEIASEPLARHYMAHGNIEMAKRVYTAALAQTTESTTKLEILHALGAIELGFGNFMEAQRIWQEACGDDNVAQHAGLCLQREKNAAYRYSEYVDCKFQIQKDETCLVQCPLAYPLPGAFVARVMDLKQCKKVIDWAEAHGSWTTGRHYAVPTHDIAVHTVPLLLAWFRDELMSHIMHPLLQQYFGEGEYYVHDAFFVKYEAASASNYLLIHTDESTHSFVLALNDNYEGGGTYFYDLQETVRPEAGSALAFRGDQMLHGGQPVTQGTRYILAAFLYQETGKSARKNRSLVGHTLRDVKKQKNAFSFDFMIPPP